MVGPKHVQVSTHVLHTLVEAVEGFWSDYRFAHGQEPHTRDMAAVAEARKALQGSPIEITRQRNIEPGNEVVVDAEALALVLRTFGALRKSYTDGGGTLPIRGLDVAIDRLGDAACVVRQRNALARERT